MFIKEKKFILLNYLERCEIEIMSIKKKVVESSKFVID